MTDLSGKIALVTGGTDGIGKELALRLTQNDVNVILVGRSEEKAQSTITVIKETTPSANVQFWQYDLSLMTQVKQLSERLHSNYSHLDIVVHCAGVMLSQRILTSEGIETVFAVQYLARYFLMREIIDLLKNASDARIVNVSAGGNVNMALDFDNLNGEKSYDGVMALRQESVANDMLTIDLNEQYPELKNYCYGPGYVRTTLLRDMPSWFQQISRFAGIFIGYTAEQAADDILALIMGNYPTGLYDRKVKQNKASGFRADKQSRTRLQAISEQLIKTAI